MSENATANDFSARYCRGCGYDLRASSDRCPECGRAFDSADPSTFRLRPPEMRLRWWMWRIGSILLCVIVSIALVFGWLWWDWRTEQAHLLAVGDNLPGPMATVSVCPRLTILSPRPLRFLTIRVTEMNLGCGIIYDQQMQHIGALKWLRHVTTMGAGVDDSSLKYLRHSTQLETLSLGRSDITDLGVAQLETLTEMVELNLAGTRITDAGLAHLAGMTKLRYLDLHGTRVTDAGLEHLRGMKQLRTLSLDATATTAAGVKRLQAALPQLSIGRE